MKGNNTDAISIWLKFVKIVWEIFYCIEVDLIYHEKIHYCKHL